jgi:TolA-binding protein
VDHQPTPNPADLVRLVRGLDPGRRVSVQVWRDGVTRSYTLKVGSRPAGSDMPMPPPNWGGQGNDDQQMPDGPRMQILRRNRDDIQRQIQELQAQIARLEGEIQALQQQMNRRDHDDHDRNRNNDDRDRDRDNNNDNDGD